MQTLETCLTGYTGSSTVVYRLDDSLKEIHAAIRGIFSVSYILR